MTGKYNEAMEYIKLTGEARERILREVENKRASGRRAGIIDLSDIKRVSAAAACLIALVLGIFALTRMINPAAPDNQIPPDAATYGPSEYADAAGLSEAVGFTVTDISDVFPQAADITYVNLQNIIAETDFTLGKSSLTFRKALGSDDISGDYNEYDRIERAEINGTVVTLKGSGDTVSLALWEKDGYSYSLFIEPPAPRDDMTGTVAKLMQ